MRLFVVHPGYSGVAVYTRNAACAPVRAEEGITGVLCPPRSTTSFRHLPLDQQIGGYPRPGQLSGAVEEALLDSEGRCVILEFPAFVLFGVYSPANRDETRDEFRNSFFEALDVRIRNLVAMGKQVIVTGDLNVIRSEIDSTNVLEALRKENMTLEEWMSLPTRRVFNQLLFGGHIIGHRDQGREEPALWDLCRCFHPQRLGMNTCWDTKRNTRPANNGSRIDYILCSDGIKDWFTFANIQEGLMGSDHCPVFAITSDRVTFQGQETALLDIMNPAGVFEQGKRIRELGQKDLLPLSAKLIPEFDRRQSIRDMFSRKPASTATNHAFVTVSSSSNLPADAPTSSLITAPEEAQTVNVTNAPGSRPANTSSPTSRKRLPEPLDAVPRQLKRAKSVTDTNASKQKVPPGQKTLRGFFKPVSAGVDESLPSPAASHGQKPQLSDVERPLASNNDSPTQSSTARPTSTASPKPSRNTPPEPEAKHGTIPTSPDAVFDPVEAKESWSKLLGKRVVPRCEHDEPCISLLTKKPGVNRGTLQTAILHS